MYVKVIPGEEIVSQHCPLFMDMLFKKKVRRKVRESEVKKEFAEGVNNKCDGNEDWCGLKRKLLDVAIEVCVILKANPGIWKSSWWNKDMDVAVCS